MVQGTADGAASAPAGSSGRCKRMLLVPALAYARLLGWSSKLRVIFASNRCSARSRSPAREAEGQSRCNDVVRRGRHRTVHHTFSLVSYRRKQNTTVKLARPRDRVPSVRLNRWAASQGI